jgi:glyoxylase-like metal-dependent hydrolase (beta-lactamase superfamily II)
MSVSTVVAVFFAASRLAAQVTGDEPIVVSDLGAGLYMLQSRGGNIGLSVGPDSTFMVDDQYAPLTERIVAEVAKLTERPIDFVLNTHWHGDHTGGNENLGAAGVWIVAHDNVRERMSTEQFLELFNDRVPPAPAVALPSITFSDSVRFHVNGETIDVVHPDGSAHTDGDSVVFFEGANVVHAGDVFFNGMYPFIDVSSGGSLSGVVRAADRILERIDDDTKIIPGHGPVSTRAELQAYRDMIDGVAKAVEAMVAAGNTRDEVIAANPTALWDDVYGMAQSFISPPVFAGIAYDSAVAVMEKNR